MRCQNCGNYEASFHYRSNINGEITEQHLCQECAQSMENSMFTGSMAGIMPMQMQGDDFFDSFFRSTFSYPVIPGMAGGYRQVAPIRSNLEEKVIPLDAGAEIKNRRELNVLRGEMEAAIKAENFEKAAELRDEIHRKEKSL